MTSNIATASLQALLDREAIRELAVRYCHYMWQQDMRVVGLYTDDGRYGQSGGRGQLEQMYAETFAGDLAPHPFAGNHVIDFDGPDHATGCCYNDLRITRDGIRTLTIGFWRDEYVRINGEWKFKERQFTALDNAQVPDPAP